MERQRFDDSWKESFKDAEVEPSESLWTNIELDLEKAEGKSMKKRVLFFKLLAAASVAFALTFAGATVYFLNKQNQSNQLAKNDSSVDASNVDPNATSAVERVKEADNIPLPKSNVNSSSANLNQDIKETGTEKTNDKRNKSKETNSGNSAGNVKSNDALLVAVNKNNKTVEPVTGVTGAANDYDLLSTHGGLPAITNLQKPGLPLAVSTPEADPVLVMMARLNEQELKYAEKEKKDRKNTSENIWTSVGFSAGSVNTVTSQNSSPQTSSQASFDTNNMNMYAVSNNIVHDQSTASGVAYSVGLSLGGKLSNRWVLQGGVNYLTQSSEYTTNAVIRDANNMSFKLASINEINKLSDAGKSDSRLMNTASYGVTSNLQYISVPLQAGYLIVNRNIGLQLNAGLSTDLFLQNTLTPEEGSLEKSTQGRGDDSPYRPVNFSGLVGTELSYRFGKHYRVALNPGLRYPFSSIYKSDISITAMPLTFDVGLRFRYIFN